MYIWLIIWFSAFYRNVYGESGCDEVDILFIVDDKSIDSKAQDVIDLMTHIAKYECSEYAGFSVIAYGDNIPTDLNNQVLLSLVDTEVIHQRDPLIEELTSQLTPKFASIKNAVNSGSGSAVSLLDAFQTISSQDQPTRDHYKTQCESAGQLETCRIGLHDDSIRIIVFDNDNSLSYESNKFEYRKWAEEYEKDNSIGKYQMQDSNDICELIRYIENDDTTGEGLIVLEGAALPDDNGQNGLVILCDGKIPQLIHDQKRKLFVEWLNTLTLIQDPEQIEIVGSMTCPANIETDDGDLDLSNHVQWINGATLNTCSFTYVDNNGDLNKPAQLTDDSYIIVRDYPDDDMSFIEQDYIIFDPDTLANTPIECEIPVIRLIKILSTDDSNPDYNVLKISVKLPLSPMEYIYNINARGENIELRSADVNNEQERRLIDIGISTTATLFHLEFKEDFEYEKVGTVEYNKKLGSNSFSSPVLTVSATGKLTISYGYGFEVDIKLLFDFNWVLFTAGVHFEIKLYGYYRIWAYFHIAFEAEASIKIANLLNWNKLKFFWLGPVPVLVRPFITLDVELKMVPIKISAGIDCEYKESWAVGYYYDKTERCNYNYYGTDCWIACALGCGFDYCNACTSDCGWFGESCHWQCRHCNSYWDITEYKIKENTVEKNGCERSLSIGDSEDACPVLEFGFDVIVTLKLGARFYDALLVYLKAELVIPFRITLPELEGPICGQSVGYDMCQLDSLKASFTVAIDLNLYIGYELNLSGILDTIADIINIFTGNGGDGGYDFSGQEAKIATITVLPKTSLGCLDLSGAFQFIDDYYRPKCCENTADPGELTICLVHYDYTGRFASRLWTWNGGWVVSPVKELQDNGNFDTRQCATFNYFSGMTNQWVYLDLMVCDAQGSGIDSIEWWDPVTKEYKTTSNFYSAYGYDANNNCQYSDGYFWLWQNWRHCTKISIYLATGAIYEGASWIDELCDRMSNALPYSDTNPDYNEEPIPLKTPPQKPLSGPVIDPPNNNNINIDNKNWNWFNINKEYLTINISTQLINIFIGLLLLLCSGCIMYYFMNKKFQNKYQKYQTVKFDTDTDVTDTDITDLYDPEHQLINKK